MRDKTIERVKSSYNDAVNAGSNVFDDLGRLESEAKNARDRARKLEDQPEVKSDAERLRQDIEKTQEAIAKLFERLASDRSTLDRVKEGVMTGANNPTIRARMEWGKQQHVAMQSNRQCDEKESGRLQGDRVQARHLQHRGRGERSRQLPARRSRSVQERRSGQEVQTEFRRSDLQGRG